MIKTIDLYLEPNFYNEQVLKNIISQKYNIEAQRIKYIKVVKKSIDARNEKIKLFYRLLVYIDEYPEFSDNLAYFPASKVTNKRVIVVGMGPAGIFASLKLLMNGIKPIIIEQGKEIYERKKDIALMYRQNEVNENSNYCYGEGGAGAFSDGKLFTRSNKKGDISLFLRILVQAGANEDILSDAYPHIGSDKLSRILKNIRKWILDSGGEIYFSTKLTDFIIESDTCKGIIANNSEKIFADAVILATGHSSRDVYTLLVSKGLSLEAKGFAMGVRVEHLQNKINLMQYHGSKYLKYLPAAEYKITEQVNGRGVYSFCMCPGGFILPAMTEKNTIVVNGMSNSKRNSQFANSGFVVEIRPEDCIKYGKTLDLLEFQVELEKLAYNAVQKGLVAPAQRIVDFISFRLSNNLPKSSYMPGIYSSPMHEWLPSLIKDKLREAFLKIKKRMPDFITEDAIMVGVETRTSSPVRIARNATTLEHVQLKNLYPCGEGAGYAGGITSSAIDGMNVAEVISNKLISK